MLPKSEEGDDYKEGNWGEKYNWGCGMKSRVKGWGEG